MGKRKISNYLINKNIQLGLAFRFLFMLLVFTIFIGFQAYITIWPVVSSYISKELLSLVKYQIFIRVIFFSIPLLLVIIGFTIIITHRVAGPIYRFEVTLDSLLRDEDVRLINLRPGDELKNLADKINSLILHLKKDS